MATSIGSHAGNLPSGPGNSPICMWPTWSAERIAPRVRSSRSLAVSASCNWEMICWTSASDTQSDNPLISNSARKARRHFGCEACLVSLSRPYLPVQASALSGFAVTTPSEPNASGTGSAYPLCQRVDCIRIARQHRLKCDRQSTPHPEICCYATPFNVGIGEYPEQDLEIFV